MTRPRKQTVDYFPHSAHVNSGKTVPALISKYGAQGYTFWFRLLELLSKTDGHGYDCNDELDWVHLQSYTFANDEFLTSEILAFLVKLRAIDKTAWEMKGIWSQNFVDGIHDVYRNRVEDIPDLKGFLHQLSVDNGIPDLSYPQSKPNQSKPKETKETFAVRFELFWGEYPRKTGKGKARESFLKIKPSLELTDKIITAVQNQKQSEQWLREKGQFIPHPATWLNQERWDDEIEGTPVLPIPEKEAVEM